MKSILIIVLLQTFYFQCVALEARVIRVIDGDTFEIQTGEKVRLIGINAPEISDVFGKEAKTHLASLIEGQTVDLLRDGISGDRDRYNRLLRYVFLNGIDINEKMVLDGYAFAYLKYRFDNAEEYKKSQLIASANNSGIWGSSNKSKIINQHDAEGNFWTGMSIQKYLIGGLILLLIFIASLYYFKK